LFFGEIQPEKYDFDLHKGFFMEKMTQMCQPDFKEKKNPNRQIFIISSNSLAKNIIEGFWFSFLLSYLVCSQIWLNHLMNDCHFSYITKLKKSPSWTLSFIGYVAMPIILPTIYLSFDPRYTLPS
jgi:hypothetical protein